MERRTFLKAVASSGLLGLAGCLDIVDDGTPSPSPSPPPSPSPGGTPTRTPPPTETSTADGSKITEVAVDVSEGEDVSGVVDGVASGERLVFPSGRFAWESAVTVTVDDWGVRCQPDTVFEVPDGIGDGERVEVISTRRERRTADNVHLENLTFDADGRAAPTIQFGVRNRGHLDGLHYRMNGPLSDRRHGNGVEAYVEHPDGLLRVDDYRQFNNADLGAYGAGNSRIGVWVGPRNEGTVHLRNPVLQGFPNNACYVSRQPGTVIVEGGLLMNNNVSAVRVSGSVEVHDTTIYIDVDRYLDGPGALEAAHHNTRGVWGDNRQAGTDGGLVRGVSFVLASYRRCTGLATILENPRMTVRDCQFLLDSDIASVRADDGEIEVTDCHFDGRSTGSTAGVGDITGAGGYVAPHIDPGDVPVRSTDPEFDWARTHLETPGRSRSGSTVFSPPGGR